jgi:DNA invertase Pin-like site-specific DNA recombinase
MGFLQDIVYEPRAKGVALKATEQPIDTSNAAGKAFLDMLGVLDEFETNLRCERQTEGIKAAKERGVYKGRKPTIDVAEVRRLRTEEKLDRRRSRGVSASAAPRSIGCWA